VLLAMSDTDIVEMGTDALVLAAKLGAPILLTTLAIGLVVGMLQSATQLQEPTIAFVPKFMGVGAVLLLSANWMLSSIVDYSRDLFEMIPRMLT
jgi:flagellar biosynthetic protein FliQ